MAITIPSTTVKSRFLKTLAVGTVYRDPRNGNVYIIQEKKVNDCLSKVGGAYFGNQEAIDIVVPDKYMKMEGIKRANIMTVMKEKVDALEKLNQDLMSKLSVKSRLEQIKELMGDRDCFNSERDVYCIADGLVYQMRIRGGDKQEAVELLNEYKQMVWKDKDMLDKLMKRQDRMQTKLLELLVNDVDSLIG